MKKVQGSGAVLYVRVSTDDQANGPLNLINQEARCRDFCTRERWPVIRMRYGTGMRRRSWFRFRSGPWTDLRLASKPSVVLNPLQQLGQRQPECLRERGQADQAWLSLTQLNPIVGFGSGPSCRPPFNPHLPTRHVGQQMLRHRLRELHRDCVPDLPVLLPPG